MEQDLANAFQNTSAILMRVVVQNALYILTALLIAPVFVPNVKIHAQELVARTRNAKSSIIFHLVIVLQDFPVIRSDTASLLENLVIIC